MKTYPITPSRCNPGQWMYRDYAIVPYCNNYLVDDLCGGSFGFFATLQEASKAVDAWIAGDYSNQYSTANS